MEEKDKFGVRMEEQLSQWKAKIDAAKDQAEGRGQDYLDRWAGELEGMLEKYDAARYKLTLLRKGGGQAVAELKEGFEKAFAELKAAVKAAKDKL